MSLYKTMVRHGHSLFRWRSLIPLIFIGPLLISLQESAHVERMIGENIDDLWVLFCIFITLCGLAIRIMTVGHAPANTSGRNAEHQRADVLNTTGLYSVVRNPLYLGNFIMLLGVAMSIKVWWLVMLAALVYFIYMERIILTEENFLEEKFGEPYETWRSRTPVIIPDLKLWVKPSLPFSWKTVMRREYPGLLAFASIIFVIEMVSDVVLNHEPFKIWLADDYLWPVGYGLVVLFCLTLRFLKKHTNLLKTDGR